MPIGRWCSPPPPRSPSRAGASASSQAHRQTSRGTCLDNSESVTARQACRPPTRSISCVGARVRLKDPDGRLARHMEARTRNCSPRSSQRCLEQKLSSEAGWRRTGAAITGRRQGRQLHSVEACRAPRAVPGRWLRGVGVVDGIEQRPAQRIGRVPIFCENQAGAVGVCTATVAGSTWPYGEDPRDSNIRIVPSFAPLADVKVAADIIALSVLLASVEKRVAQA